MKPWFPNPILAIQYPKHGLESRYSYWSWPQVFGIKIGNMSNIGQFRLKSYLQYWYRLGKIIKKYQCRVILQTMIQKLLERHVYLSQSQIHVPIEISSYLPSFFYSLDVFSSLREFRRHQLIFQNYDKPLSCSQLPGSWYSQRVYIRSTTSSTFVKSFTEPFSIVDLIQTGKALVMMTNIQKIKHEGKQHLLLNNSTNTNPKLTSFPSQLHTTVLVTPIR